MHSMRHMSFVDAGLQQYCLISQLRRTVLRHFAREVIKCQRPEMEEGGDEASPICQRISPKDGKGF